MASPTPRATILVPVYNSATTLERCLRSAIGQTLRDVQILVMDDASTDDSAICAQSIARDDQRVTILSCDVNGGKPKAMNEMMRQARGDWVAVLDADDAMAPERLEHLISLAEHHGVDMVADNLLYIDSGIYGSDEKFGIVLRTAFSETVPDRVVALADLLKDADNHSDFDYGILKPIIRRSFLLANNLVYNEGSRLAEDFTYLLDYMVAGGRLLVCAAPLYSWTMPFGTVSRKWTSTGAGAWRYDYRNAIDVNAQYTSRMRAEGRMDVVQMLERRGRQYTTMMHYIAAQRNAAEGHKWLSVIILAQHPSTWGLLVRRVWGRVRRHMNTTATRRLPV